MTTKRLLSIAGDHWDAGSALAVARDFELRAVADLDEANVVLANLQFLVGIIELGSPGMLDRVEHFLRAHWRVKWVAVCSPEALQDERYRRLIHDHCIDFHTLPVDLARLSHTLGHAYGFATLADPAPRLTGASGMRLTGNSQAITALRQRLHKVACAEAPVLIWGESGTGKELVARAVHEGSSRRAGPFVPINCGAIPAGLVQSELFGHEKGAFTGAGKARAGLIESACGGTVFLDEIADLPLDLQANLLRFLQEKTIARVGGTRQVEVDVRIVAASHVRLHEAVARGAFREDLFYRLNVLSLEVPPLRERGDDVQALAETFFQDYARERSPHVKGFSRAALASLCAHDWPGNVRELLNRVRRASVMAEGRLITPQDLGLADAAAGTRVALNGARVQAERAAIEAGLGAGKSLTDVARDLGISRMTLYRLMAKHGIETAARKRS